MWHLHTLRNYNRGGGQRCCITLIIIELIPLCSVHEVKWTWSVVIMISSAKSGWSESVIHSWAGFCCKHTMFAWAWITCTNKLTWLILVPVNCFQPHLMQVVYWILQCHFVISMAKTQISSGKFLFMASRYYTYRSIASNLLLQM